MFIRFAFILLFSTLGFAQPKDVGMASSEQAKELKDVGIEEKLGQKIDLTLQVQNEKNETLPLSAFVSGKKPIIFSLVYFNCPGLCNFHLNGVTEALKKMDWNVGNEFDVIALSFDPKENGTDVGLKKKESYIQLYGRQDTGSGWHFLTADAATLKTLTESVGFKYKWVEESKEWAHASAAIILTPDGKISRYLHGILFEPKDVKFALIEASEGKIGTFAEKLIWYCYHYDPKTSKYSIAAFKVMQLGGGLVVLVLMLALVPFWLKSRREQKV